jgi:hypothetical protein
VRDLLDGVEHDVGTDGAIEADDVGARAVEPLGDGLRQSPYAVRPSVPMVICAMIGSEQTSRTARMACSTSAMLEIVSSTKRSTPPSRSASACSRKNAARFVERRRSVRLDADAERTERAGHVDASRPPPCARCPRRAALMSRSSSSMPKPAA